MKIKNGKIDEWKINFGKKYIVILCLSTILNVKTVIYVNEYFIILLLSAKINNF